MTMSDLKDEVRTFHSFEEYREAYFPKSTEEPEESEPVDPFEFGEDLARESLLVAGPRRGLS